MPALWIRYHMFIPMSQVISTSRYTRLLANNRVYWRKVCPQSCDFILILFVVAIYLLFRSLSSCNVGCLSSPGPSSRSKPGCGIRKTVARSPRSPWCAVTPQRADGHRHTDIKWYSHNFVEISVNNDKPCYLTGT